MTPKQLRDANLPPWEKCPECLLRLTRKTARRIVFSRDSFRRAAPINRWSQVETFVHADCVRLLLREPEKWATGARRK